VVGRKEGGGGIKLFLLLKVCVYRVCVQRRVVAFLGIQIHIIIPSQPLCHQLCLCTIEYYY
jgi:hypothetical protein